MVQGGVDVERPDRRFGLDAIERVGPMKPLSLALVLASSLATLGLAGCQTVEEDGYVYSSTYEGPTYRGVYETDYVYRDRPEGYRRAPPRRYYEPPQQRRYDPPPQRRYDPPPRGPGVDPGYGHRGPDRPPQGGNGTPWVPPQDPLLRSPSH